MTRPVRIPSDIHRPDRILGPLTARQVTVLAIAAACLYAGWALLRHLMPTVVFLLAAIPPATAALVLALAQRDGISLDRFLLAALRHHLRRLRRRAKQRWRSQPRALPRGRSRQQVTHHRGPIDRSTRSAATPDTPEWLHPILDRHQPPPVNPPQRRTPGMAAAGAVTLGVRRRDDGVGVVDLNADGLVVIAVVSTVNLTLRTPAEQDTLLAEFARYLHAVSGPTQLMVHAVPLDLTGHLHALDAHADRLSHPALAAAARGHRRHLTALAAQRGSGELLTRQVLLVLREPRTGPRPPQLSPRTRGESSRDTGHAHRPSGAEQRLLRRVQEAQNLLSPLDVSLTTLSPEDTASLLAGMTNPSNELNAQHPTHQTRTARGASDNLGDHLDPGLDSGDRDLGLDDYPDDVDELHREIPELYAASDDQATDAAIDAATDDDPDESDDGWGPDEWMVGRRSR